MKGMKGQSLNTDALVFLSKVLSKPSLLLPHLSVPHVGYVDWKALKNAGIKGIVFDKDNTLTSPYMDDFHPVVVPSLKKCRELFGNENILLVSNSVGGPDDIGYLGADKVEIALGMTVFRRQTKKPKGFTELLAWFNREENMKGGREPITPNQLCMIGDRTLTDVVFGNVHGMLTIHVEHLTSKDDNVVASALRSAENRFLQPFAKDFLRVKRSPHDIFTRGSCFVLDFPETNHEV